MLPVIPEDETSIQPSIRTPTQNRISRNMDNNINRFNRNRLPYFTQSVHGSEEEEPTLRMDDTDSTKHSTQQGRGTTTPITTTVKIPSQSPQQYQSQRSQPQQIKSMTIDDQRPSDNQSQSHQSTDEDSDMKLNLDNIQITPQGDEKQDVIMRSTQIQDNNIIQPEQMQLDLQNNNNNTVTGKRTQSQRIDSYQRNQMQINSPQSFEQEPPHVRRRLNTPDSRQQMNQDSPNQSRQQQQQQQPNNNNSQVLLLQGNNIMNRCEWIKRARKSKIYNNKSKHK